MAKLSKAALERKQKQKTELEKEIAEYRKKISELRNSNESPLTKTQKIKNHQQKIRKLNYRLSNI
jgi:predicted  nucleic acid-binding Zn-ribbon protein